MKLTKEQIIDIFNRYCFINCCGRVCHAYVNPEHRIMMPIPEHDGFYLINYEEEQAIVYGNPSVARYGDVEHYPRFDLDNAEWIAEFGFGTWNWDERGYSYYDNQTKEYLVKNPENDNGFYDCKANLPKRWGY